MLSTSYTTQQYISTLSSIDESIAQLLKERTSVETLMRKSKIADILKQDATWLEACTVQPRDWAYLLKASTSLKEWRKYVAIEGIIGASNWSAVEERVLTMFFYNECPERVAVYALLIEHVLPFMQPWVHGMQTTCARRFASIKNYRGFSLLLSIGTDNVWTLSDTNGRSVETFPNLIAALNQAQRLSARSFFETP